MKNQRPRAKDLNKNIIKILPNGEHPKAGWLLNSLAYNHGNLNKIKTRLTAILLATQRSLVRPVWSNSH